MVATSYTLPKKLMWLCDYPLLLILPRLLISMIAVFHYQMHYFCHSS